MVNYSVEESFLMLNKIQEEALSLAPKPDFSAALKAEELKGKLFTLYHAQLKSDEEKNIPQILVKFVDKNNALCEVRHEQA